MSNAVSQAEFARVIGASKSYVSQLKKAGRLVLNDAGLVLVDESRTRIAESADPSKNGKRHSDQVGSSYQAARAVKERYQAMLAKLEYERTSGQVVPKADVEQAVAEVVTVFRMALENMPFRVAPEVIGQDLGKARAILRQYVLETLTQMEAEFDARLAELGSE